MASCTPVRWSFFPRGPMSPYAAGAPFPCACLVLPPTNRPWCALTLSTQVASLLLLLQHVRRSLAAWSCFRCIVCTEGPQHAGDAMQTQNKPTLRCHAESPKCGCALVERSSKSANASSGAALCDAPSGLFTHTHAYHDSKDKVLRGLWMSSSRIVQWCTHHNRHSLSTRRANATPRMSLRKAEPSVVADGFSASAMRTQSLRGTQPQARIPLTASEVWPTRHKPPSHLKKPSNQVCISRSKPDAGAPPCLWQAPACCSAPMTSRLLPVFPKATSKLLHVGLPSLCRTHKHTDTHYTPDFCFAPPLTMCHGA